MNQPLSAAKLAELTTTFPAPLTKREKLLALADLVGRCSVLYMYSNLEHWGPHHLSDPSLLHQMSAFGLAATHEPFRADGLTGNTVGAVKNYLELTNEEMHAFSCDCGGRISAEETARRLRAIAG